MSLMLSVSGSVQTLLGVEEIIIYLFYGAYLYVTGAVLTVVAVSIPLLLDRPQPKKKGFLFLDY